MIRRRRDTHAWSQQHLSHYVEGDLSWLARRRLRLHAAECPECGLGLRAVRALLRMLHAPVEQSREHAPDSVLNRVRAAATDPRSEADLGTQARDPHRSS
jgi:hypothetical protein